VWKQFNIHLSSSFLFFLAADNKISFASLHFPQGFLKQNSLDALQAFSKETIPISGQICMPAVEQKLSKEKAGSYPQHSLERSLLEGISVQSPSGLELYPFWTDSIQRREGRG